jgi:hypothetical protein
MAAGVGAGILAGVGLTLLSVRVRHGAWPWQRVALAAWREADRVALGAAIRRGWVEERERAAAAAEREAERRAIVRRLARRASVGAASPASGGAGLAGRPTEVPQEEGTELVELPQQAA